MARVRRAVVVEVVGGLVEEVGARHDDKKNWELFFSIFC